MTRTEKELQKAILKQAKEEYQEALDHLNYADDEHFDKAVDKFLQAETQREYDIALVKANYGCHITRGFSKNKKDVEPVKIKRKAVDLILACKEELKEMDRLVFHRDYGDTRYIVAVIKEKKDEQG